METASGAPSALHERLAARVRELRAARGFSLDELATRSGVSRSMISLIERGESSPTAVVLDRLASGLGVMLLSLFDASTAVQPPSTGTRDLPRAIAASTHWRSWHGCASIR